jgi:hypothetical protein
MKMRKTLAVVGLLAVLFAVPGFQSVGGKIPNSRTVCLTAGANTIGPINVPSNIVAKRLKLDAEIGGYGAPGETAAYQFNGDTGNNYTVFWASTADGVTWAAGANKAAATDRIRIGPADTQAQRIVSATLFDNAAKTEHMIVFDSATGTGSTAQSTLDAGNGKYVSPTPTAITSVKLVTTNANMGSGSCLTVSW